MIGEFRESLYPWINLQPGDDTQSILNSFLRVRNGLDDLLEGKILWQDYLDIVASEGVDMDDYLGTSLDNIITVGF